MLVIMIEKKKELVALLYFCTLVAVIARPAPFAHMRGSFSALCAKGFRI
jgi:hypothetical protein